MSGGPGLDQVLPADRNSQVAGMDALTKLAEWDYPSDELDSPSGSASSGSHGAQPGEADLAFGDASDSTTQFRAALSSFGPRKSRKLHGRLSRWKPRYW